MFDKIWDDHVVKEIPGGRQVIYIDQHFIHEVTSPQAFDGLRKRGIKVFRKDKTLATADHNVPTINQHLPIKEALSKKQVDTLTKNCKDFDIELYGLGHKNQGIVHVIGPELGITKPGITIVCGDSHTSTHGAFGNIAFGIGTSQVEQVLSTQCLILSKPKKMRITVEGKVGKATTAKDIILYIISKMKVGGCTGYFVEYAGDAITALSMEGRMTVCNMSIEMGARGGMIAPDSKTIAYLKSKKHTPKGKAFEKATEKWLQLKTDKEAEFDKEVVFKASNIKPMLTYGTNPGMGISIGQTIPETETDSQAKSLNYMNFDAGEKMEGKIIQHVFIGSCTNARIEDLRLVANFVNGKKKANHVKVMVVPGSKNVELLAREEGLDKIFEAAGFELRQAGCSACLGMNEDKIPAGEYCISTSNRNFEGRQGPGARTILASPLMAAAAAIEGKIVDVRAYIN